MPGRTAVAATVVALALPALAWATFERPCDRDAARDVAIFYYAWYGTPARDGAWLHWSQGGVAAAARPRRDVLPGPWAVLVVRRGGRRGAHARDGRSRRDDRRRVVVGPRLDRGRAAAAPQSGRGATPPPARRPRRAVREPHASRRSPPTSRTCARSASATCTCTTRRTLPDQDWATLNGLVDDMRLFANTRLPGKAKAGGFDGLYTYDVLLYDGGLFPPHVRAGPPARPDLCAVRRPGLRRAERDARPTHPPAAERRHVRLDVARRDQLVRRRGHDHELQRMARGDADRACPPGRRPLPVATTARGERAVPPRRAAYLERTAYWSFRFRGGPHGVIIP